MDEIQKRNQLASLTFFITALVKLSSASKGRNPLIQPKEFITKTTGKEKPMINPRTETQFQTQAKTELKQEWRLT